MTRSMLGGRGRPDGPGIDLPTPTSALVIVAHPDDGEFQAGATLAKWAADGSTVHHLVLTDGSRGTWDPDADTAALIAVRRDEQRNAARTLGATGEVVFLDHVDGDLQSGLEERGQVAEVIRRLRPQVVLGHDPWRRYRLHPDHRHAGWLAVDGCVAARDPHYHREHDLPHHRPDHLLLFEPDEPNHLEEVSAFVDVKLAALFAHESQLRSTMHIDPDDDGTQRAAFETRIRADLADTGRPVGLAGAEAFYLLDL